MIATELTSCVGLKHTAQMRTNKPKDIDYSAYIQSSAWRSVRKRYQESKLPQQCCACQAPWRAGFHYHHRSYKRLGNELLRDIMPMCESCHVDLHNKFSKVTSPHQNLFKFTNQYRKKMRKLAAR